MSDIILRLDSQLLRQMHDTFLISRFVGFAGIGKVAVPASTNAVSNYLNESFFFHHRADTLISPCLLCSSDRILDLPPRGGSLNEAINKRNYTEHMLCFTC
jgi:hypothetical protein